jgi:hypothetical protein
MKFQDIVFSKVDIFYLNLIKNANTKIQIEKIIFLIYQ